MGLWECGPCAHTPASVVLDSGEKESLFHYTQAYAIMKAILIGFNAWSGARSCFLMALSKEHKSVMVKASFSATPSHASIIPSSVCPVCVERKTDGQTELKQHFPAGLNPKSCAVENISLHTKLHWSFSSSCRDTIWPKVCGRAHLCCLLNIPLTWSTFF